MTRGWVLSLEEWQYDDKIHILRARVGDTTQRAVELRCRRALRDGEHSYPHPGVAVRPAIWAGELEKIEDKWATYAHNINIVPPGEQDVPPAWLRDPTSRPSREDRERQRRVTTATLSPFVDALARDTETLRAPWDDTWATVHHSATDRRARSAMYLLLHGALKCGAGLFYRETRGMARIPQDRRARAFCNHEGCPEEIPEDYTHIFLASPVAAAVWRWVATVGAALSIPALGTGTQALLCGVAPPLAGNQPRGGRVADQMLAEKLRSSTIYALYCAHQRDVLVGRGMASRQVVSMIYAGLARHFREDQYRVECAREGGLPVHMEGIPPDWFSGEPANLGEEDFAMRWCRPGLASGALAAEATFDMTPDSLGRVEEVHTRARRRLLAPEEGEDWEADNIEDGS